MRKVFAFKSGHHFEVAYHHGRRCWVASREIPSGSALYGYGGTPLLAVRDLRAVLARNVQATIRPGYEVIIDEGTDGEQRVWIPKTQR